jgi:hypothetical protein
MNPPPHRAMNPPPNHASIALESKVRLVAAKSLALLINLMMMMSSICSFRNKNEISKAVV